MRSKDKRMMAGNRTIDQFLVRKDVSAPFIKQNIGQEYLNLQVTPQAPLQQPISWYISIILKKYPKNPEIRDYQQQIVLSCVCTNTLVCLPTGLGKTHIAAVLIANFVTWFPDKKVVFLAPTRPLVRQQVSALNHLRDMVPKNVILEVNGQLAAKKREQLYDSFRVIFATPQTIENDIRNGKLDKTKIIMFIFDECHRSVGDSSYAKIIRLMAEVQSGYRIIGLSATPGHEAERVQAVISNLNLVQMIYKDDTDPDVRRYLNQKVINEVQIRSTDTITEICDILNEFSKPSICLLIKMNVLSPWLVKNGIKTTSFFMVRQQFSLKSSTLNKKEKQIGYAALRILHYLIQSRKSLCERGFDTFKRIFFGSLSSQRPKNEPKADPSEGEESIFNEQTMKSTTDSLPQFQFDDEITSNSMLSSVEGNSTVNLSQSDRVSKLPSKFQMKMMESQRYKRLYQIFFERKENARIHPKLQKLIEILQIFFKTNEGKVIVFTNFRVTAKQIHECLKNIPEIKSEVFFGQSKTVFQESEEETSVIYLKQSEQLKIVQRFKRGEINTLISTCIGEEGLDIGEVDCIVCYDGGHSPIRSIQRRGRTGRKRAGSVFFLLMEGKEWEDYKNGMKKQEKMKKMLTRERGKFQYYSYNSTLFEENTEIVVEHFENQLNQGEEETEEEGKKTKPKIAKQKKGDKDGGKTKKRKSKKMTQNQESSFGCQEDVEIKVTKISDLLNRYQESEDSNIQQNSEESIQGSIQGSIQEKPEIEERPFVFETSIDYSKNEVIKQQQEEEQSDCEKLQKQQINEQIKIQLTSNDLETELLSSQDEEGDIFLQFLRLKACEQVKKCQNAVEQVNEQSDNDSISSDEFRGIMQKLQKRRNFQSLIDSDSQP